MPTPDLLDTLCSLLPSQLDVIFVKLRAPTQHFSGPGAPLAARAVELLRWADQQGRRADLEHLCAQMVPASAAPQAAQTAPPPTGATTPSTRPRPWGARLTGPEMKELTEALLHTFPSRTELAQMLRFGLDKHLDALTASSNLSAAVFELLTTAEAQGWIPELFEAARRHAPQSPSLRVIAEKRALPDPAR